MWHEISRQKICPVTQPYNIITVTSKFATEGLNDPCLLLPLPARVPPRTRLTYDLNDMMVFSGLRLTTLLVLPKRPGGNSTGPSTLLPGKSRDVLR
ncbi:hypothetical protein RND71_039113 [Anisodus tanguticus]|uniref:Uncharacterized protein n=1 Tax=Anisodus tanguticus TaxID=243964 RepID=A0AAE1URQ9_9SOLA|nr:hypothetical protein RND71_039113 [Anisodus tanguticus]